LAQQFQFGFCRAFPRAAVLEPKLQRMSGKYGLENLTGSIVATGYMTASSTLVQHVVERAKARPKLPASTDVDDPACIDTADANNTFWATGFVNGK
jgi:hypothetical protein